MAHQDPRLDELLRQSGMSQRELARRVGYHPNTVNRWRKAPTPVIAYLELYARVRRSLSQALEDL